MVSSRRWLAALGLAAVVAPAAVVALAATLLGCGDADSSADSSAGSERGTSHPAARPLPSGPEWLRSSDGHLAVRRPSAPGWDCLEARHGEGQGAAVALRCRRSNTSEFLFLAAKTHRQPPDQRVDAETLLMSLYRADNEAFFARVDYRSDGPVFLDGSPGWQAELVAEHPRVGDIRKREAVTIVGDRIFAVSAEGDPRLVSTHAELIEQWFTTVRLARL